MKLVRTLLLTAALCTLTAGTASAVAITLSLDNVTQAGGSNPSLQTYVPGFPIVGSGSMDFGAGTGFVTLPNYSIFIDIASGGVFDGDDVRLDIAGWTQNISSTDGSGNLTSTGGGTTSCTVLGGIGSFVCPTIAPTVPGWPPADGSLLLSSAVIDTLAQTIVITDNSSDAVAGTITQFYSYTVPEPTSGLLLLAGLGLMVARQRRSA